MDTRNFTGQLAYLDRRLHDPDRLEILTVLSQCEQADVLFLRRITRFPGEKLSFQLAKLARTGWIEIEERFEEARNLVRLSGEGRQTIESYWARREASPEGRPPAAAERGSPAAPEPAEGRATRFGLTVYQGGRMKRSDR